MVYNINKELVPYRDKPYVFIPTNIFIQKGIYYVSGTVVSEAISVTFRMDMIRNTRILENPIPEMSFAEIMAQRGAEKISDNGKIRIYKEKSNRTSIVKPAVYPECDKTVHAKMKCKNSLLLKVFEDFSDKFKYLNLSDCGDNEHFMLEIPCASFVNTAHWALSVCDDCEVTEPTELREAVIDMMERNTYGV